MSIRTLRSKSRIISFILLENEAIFIWERSDGILRKVSALKSNIDAHSMCIYITKIHRDTHTHTPLHATWATPITHSMVTLTKMINEKYLRK